MYDDFYLTDEHYAIAKKNGLSKTLVQKRHYIGWDIERAITEPKNNQGYLKEMVKKAADNGIDITVYAISDRKNKLGWTDEEIVTIPLGERRNNENKEYEKRALKNNIGILTFRGRLRRGWTKEKASTEPVQSVYRSRYKTN